MTVSRSATIKAAYLNAQSNTHQKYRPDIDGLRALAVLGVIVFHAFPTLLSGGFVGVDVFFVISGYLITSIINNAIQEKRFSIADFYSRRITRIFPALLTVILTAILFSWLFILPSDFKLIGKHIIGGIGFVQNLVLYDEIGYFNPSAKVKPLLHLWSLGVEEQFYLFLPILAILLSKRITYFTLAITSIALISFSINLYYTHTNPAAAFYLPISRAWELLAGSIVALIGTSEIASKKIRDALSVTGLLLIAISMALFNERMLFPGWLVLLPTLGTSLLIAVGPNAIINKHMLSSKPFVFIGLISYPLYLWHWPLLSFSWLIDSTSRTERLALVAAAFTLAWLTYRFVERPIRNYENKAKSAIALAFCGAIVATFGISIYKNEGYPARENLKEYNALDQAMRWDYATNELCTKTFGKPEHIESWMFCYTNTAKPEIAIIGNSFANHLYPGLANNDSMASRGILSIGVCEPSAHTDWGIPDNPLSPCASRKADLEKEFLNKLIKNTTSIKYVILNAWWPNFNENGDFEKRDDQKNTKTKKINIYDQPYRDTNSSFENYFYGLSERISTLEKLNKVIIIIGPKPELGKHIRECINRPLKQKPAQCASIREVELAKQKKFREGIRLLQQTHPKLKYFNPFDLFCNNYECHYFLDGKPLLRDDAHLSLYGSSYVMDSFVAWARSNIPGFVN